VHTHARACTRAQAGFAASGHPAVKPELDLVEDDDQITHEMSLEDKHDPQVRRAAAALAARCRWVAPPFPSPFPFLGEQRARRMCVTHARPPGSRARPAVRPRCMHAVGPAHRRAQAILNVFKADPEYAQHEAQYRAIARELLGEESSDGEEEGGGGEGGSGSEGAGLGVSWERGGGQQRRGGGDGMSS
jgi:hypothetical protein